MTCLSPVRHFWRTPLSICCLIVAGCASSAPTPKADVETSPEEARSSVFLIDDRGLVRVVESNPEADPIQPKATFGGFYSVRSKSKDVIISLNGESATKLGLLSADGSFQTIHVARGQATYTAAWSEDDRLVFGYDYKTGGGIGILEPDGTIKDVGCSASNRALGWAGDDKLIVADADNRYVVAASNCRTISRVDSRKLHEEVVNPRKPLVAYILRELEYDRAARQYVPDSSLHISDPDGANAVLVAGNRYRPRRPVWSPDGAELAFDAQLPDQPGRRLISIYDLESGSSAFLNPSSLDAPISEWDAHWSPRGLNMAYLQKYGDGEPNLIVRPLNGSFTAIVGESGERFARWIDDNYLVVTNGAVERVVSIDGVTSLKVPADATIVRVE